MKNKRNKFNFLIALFIISYFTQITVVNAQKTMNKSEIDSYITDFDVDVMAKKHLVDYIIVRKRAIWNYGREFVYKNIDDKSNVFITVGLHPTIEDAENIAHNYLNGISIRMNEGLNKEESIGDKFWWWSPISDSNYLTNILFVRNNVLIIMSCSKNYEGLKNLSKLIDKDLIDGANYITRKNVINIPEIKTISTDKDSVKTNGNIKIKVNAFDPNNEALEYQFSPGLEKTKSDPENVFIYKAGKNLVHEPSDSLIVKIVVINESNMVSPISKLKIKK